ncbi:hypothetical protein AAF712_001553 [Marasmius tenuissimus]|uniref:Uncharacterized protein n=1 Tax=Marasmius tenuissimus TaxID=585030 RepID=A0ABR3AAJ5_9AGAR
MDTLKKQLHQSLKAKDLHKIAQGLEDIVELAQLLPPTDWKAYWNVLSHNDSINDRYLFLEKILVLMSRLGDSKQDSPGLRKVGEEIEEFMIDLCRSFLGVFLDSCSRSGFQVYKDLPHPPSAYLSNLTGNTPPPAAAGGSISYASRSSDGSGYNPLFPSLGKAGTPYARSVSSTKFPPLSSLPDPSLVFDTLLKREKFVEHPGGVSSLFFAFADLVIHSIFNTNVREPTLNDSSSYLDLSILYGSSDAQVQKVRRKDGTGRLWDDVFADSRLMLMPPATCALLVLLCRNHNYIADRIYLINERRAYKKPQELSDEQRKAQDEEIFQRARLVNSGYFVQIILGDYVGAILGQVRDGQDWRLNPLLEMRQVNHEWAPRGEGNVISIEFNLLYRWHATLSQEDERWTEKVFKEYLGEDDLSQVDPKQFHVAAGKALRQPDDPREWSFEGLERVDGKFKDEDLARILMDATEYRAGAFKARGIPEALKVVEVLGIERARQWGTCSLNEFRKFMGLKPYTSFEEWNRDKDVANTARSLYKDINNLELYVGLQAEEAKEPGPGAGLCPGYTISRAILADAVCLTRGDRYLTVDFTPFNLTTWGYEDCQFNPQDGSYGGMLTKLLFRTLPDQYTPGSAYAHFPFLDPVYMKAELGKRDAKEKTQVRGKYTWDRPGKAVETKTVTGYREVQEVMAATGRLFVDGSESRLKRILGHGVPELDFVQKHLIAHKDKWANHFASSIDELLQARAIKHVGKNVRSVDIVRDVLNVLPVRWVCRMIAGLPVSSEPSPAPIPTKLTEGEYCRKFQDVCQYAFLDLDYYNDWQLRESSIAMYKKMKEEVTKDFAAFDSVIKDTYNSFLSYDSQDYSREFLKQLWADRGAADAATLADALFCEVLPTAAHFSQALAHAVDYYLGDGEERKKEREELSKLAMEHGVEARAMVVKMIYKALAANPPISGTFLTALRDSHGVKAGERVFVSLRPDEEQVEHPNLGLGSHGLLLKPLFELIAPQVLGIILGLPGLQRAQGESGKFNKFEEDFRGVPLQQYVTYDGGVSPFPDSLVIQVSGLSDCGAPGLCRSKL